MGYDELSFQGPQLLTTADLSIPDATFHIRLSRDGWAACSMLTTRADLADTATVRLLQEISPPHDFAVAVDDLYSVPLGYAPGSRWLTSFGEFLSDARRDDRPLIVFEPHGFVIDGDWGSDEGELLVQDARVSPVVHAVFNFPNSRVPDWLNTLDRLAAALWMAES